MLNHRNAPIIGITTCTCNEEKEFPFLGAYAEAIRRSGGFPLLLMPGEQNYQQILTLVDGLIFSGGGDIAPTHYNGASHPHLSLADPLRDQFELTLARLALKTQMPLLGICRGLQVFSVVEGGDLMPHVPDQVGDRIAHRCAAWDASQHPVHLVPETRLANIMAVEETTVVSWHHQATMTVPRRWAIAAQAPDGIIEAIEHQQHPWAIALQWHPEMSINNPAHERLFQNFVDAAQRSSNRSLSYQVA